MKELSRWTSTVEPSALVTVTSYPVLVKSVVTASAVPLPTDLTAAAWALVASAPVTVVSAFSCAVEPCAGIEELPAGGEGVVAVVLVLAVVLALVVAAWLIT